MAGLVEKLTAQVGGEPAGALNDIVAQLWPNINVAGSQMIKEIVDPMFKTMLPGPLASLHFTKVDLGDVPMKFSNVKVVKTTADGIKLDLNLDWKGNCDIQLDGNMIPQIGVKSVELHGRLSVLLCPITNILPLIGAAQLAFINPPVLKLDFTGAANIADLSLIDSSVRKVILGVINSMFTLPNRFLYKLDAQNDYFKTYHEPLGIIRITVEKATGFAKEAQSSAKKLFSKLTRASPDCFTEVTLGAEEPWSTSTQNNTTNPTWNETHDFVVTDLDQCIKFNLEDHDLNSNDEVGLAVTTVREALAASGGRQELSMVLNNEPVDGKISITSQYFPFAASNDSLSSSANSADGSLCGLLTILIAGARNVAGQRSELQPSVVVTWGSDAKRRFQTAIITDAPGTDINNPAFDTQFRIPVGGALVAGGGGSIRIALMNKDKEVGGVDVPFERVRDAQGMVLTEDLEVGGGATVRASFVLKGVGAAGSATAELPQR